MAFDDKNQVVESAWPSLEPKACRALWAAVFQAQWDLVFQPVEKDNTSEVVQAVRWFGSRDFFVVCILIGLDGPTVLRQFRKRLAEERPVRAVQCGALGWHRIRAEAAT